MRKLPFFLAILLILVITFSCRQEDGQQDQMFTLLAPAATGIDFENRLRESEQFNIIQYLYFNNGAGVAAGDINNDGYVDLYFSSNQESNRLYLNNGDFTFEDITEGAGIAGDGDWSTGVSMADVNGDGYLDIYLCQVGGYKGLEGRNQLFINQGDLSFREQAREYGLDFQGFSTQSAFFDYDLDGDLDMYLLNHSVHTSLSYGPASLRNDKDARAGDRLFRNEGPGANPIFVDVTSEAGIYSSQIGYGLGVNVSDINNDGWPDIYVSNDFHENDYLYVNQGNGTFAERLTEMMALTSRSSMGNDVADINNDGHLDVMVLDMLPDDEKIRKRSGGEDDYELFRLKLDYGYHHQYVRNTLQLNRGGGRFSEIGRMAGVHSTDWSWSPLLCDLDNDGWKDLFITNGIYRRPNDLDYVSFLTGGNRFFPMRDNSGVSDMGLYEKMPLQPDVNFIFRNNQDLTFSNMAEEWGLETPSYSNGSAWADLDNDGDLDLITNNINSPAFVLKNNTETALDHHSLSVMLQGEGKNTKGIGTRIWLWSNGQVQVSEQHATHGFMSSSLGKLHFGLGSASTIDSLKVRWPDLSSQTLYNLAADQVLTLNIRDAAPTQGSGSTQEKGQASPLHISRMPVGGLGFTHREDAFEDLQRERLIPFNLSSEGPSVAVADVDGDGLEDLFTGGAKGQAAVLLKQNPMGEFNSVSLEQFTRDRFTEDVDALFFDADGDGDQDLYLVRGGNEYAVGDPFLADRLLFNNGKGEFSNRPGAIPYNTQNGSCVTASDYDMDGDMDLFVGSRSVPGAYGISPPSFLLKNDGKGNFTDVTDLFAPVLRKAGLISDALWADMNGDQSPDLILVGDWMNISVFINQGGRLKKWPVSNGLEQSSGWWNCIEATDLDGDGDLDLVAGNLGLNSELKASMSEPLDMYLNDFDNNGSLDQVICTFRSGRSLPIASLDELAGQIRGLKEKYPSFSDFAGLSVREIFGQDAIDRSLHLQATFLESALFLNDGKGHFETRPLPDAAQFSSVRDIMISDISGDGIKDLILVGNNYAIRPSLGRSDASYGLCLLGSDSLVFKQTNVHNNGLKVVGDSRRILPISLNKQKSFVVPINNGELQVFKLSE